MVSFLSLSKLLFPEFFLTCKAECWAATALLTDFSTIVFRVFGSKILKINFKEKRFFLYIYMFQFYSAYYLLHIGIYVVISKCLNFISWSVYVDNH